jgi:hypothetical protein
MSGGPGGFHGLGRGKNRLPLDRTENRVNRLCLVSRVRIQNPPGNKKALEGGGTRPLK